MRPEKFKPFFEKLSKEVTVSLISKDTPPKGKSLRVPDNLPVFEALDLLEKCDSLITESGEVFTKEDSMKKPVKTLFYALIIEIEYRLYKVLKSRVDSIDMLREAEFNELIRLFLADSELFNLQKVYSKESEMKDDLKAISSFRNVIMHSPRKIDLETSYNIVIKRKNQALKLMKALDDLYFK